MSVTKVAQILTRLKPKTTHRLLDYLKNQHSELAMAIRDKMFLFEDLHNLDDREMQALLREIPQETLIIALQGSQKTLLEKILSNLSQQGSEALRTTLSMAPPRSPQQVESARQVILDTVRTHHAHGVQRFHP